MPNKPRAKAARRGSGAPRKTKSRGVGKRAGLSRDAILDAALVVVQRHGLEKLTVRRLAAEAGVSPMAVYHYFDDKEEIILGVIDRVVAAAAVTAHEVDTAEWREWLIATFDGIYRTLLAQPTVIPLLANSLLYGPATLAVLDEVLGALRSAGFDGPTAARGVHALMSYTVGAAQLQAGAGSQSRPLIDAGFGSANAEALPNLAETSEELFALTRSDPFARGFDLLLEGLDALVVANS